MDKTYIFGHKSPDTDTITSSLVMCEFERQLGNENAVNYYENANLELSMMTAKAKGKGNEMQDKAINSTMNQVNLDNEIEREF